MNFGYFVPRGSITLVLKDEEIRSHKIVFISNTVRSCLNFSNQVLLSEETNEMKCVTDREHCDVIIGKIYRGKVAANLIYCTYTIKFFFRPSFRK